jgi:hypothetical protein
MPGLLSQENRRALARGLLDTTQAASNSAASTVSAPVDALAWLLRKAGAPIPQAPFGGSDWMKAQGLMRDVQSPYANAVGETIGGVLPIVAAAKGPQIAAGLLKMGENAAARTPMNAATGNQAGAIVWHGSPHKFDRFDASKMGTGEGAQAYGMGHYTAEDRGIADVYRRKLTGVDGTPVAHPDQSLQVAVGRLENQIRQLQQSGDASAPAMIKAYQSRIAELDGSGSLYKIDLPDDQIAKMLDWDKPLSKQSKAVQKAFEPHVAPIRQSMAQKAGSEWGDLAAPQAYDPTGNELLGLLRQGRDNMTAGSVLSGGVGPEVSAALRAAGIPGIRYLDGGSRGTGSGTSNFVVFPGNEGLLNILERNGKPIR